MLTVGIWLQGEYLRSVVHYRSMQLEVFLPAARWARSQNLTLQAATETSDWEIPFPVFISLYFLHRRGHNVLKVQLPSKEEHVILVRLSKIQRALYTEFMNRFRDAGNSGWLGLNPLKAFCVCCKVGFGRRCKEIF